MSSIPWPFPEARDYVSSLTRRASERVRSWAQKRQGTDPATTTLRPGRVYILPTGVGLVFGLMAFAMLLGSMNYNNNLSFVLTFFLIGIGFFFLTQGGDLRLLTRRVMRACLGLCACHTVDQGIDPETWFLGLVRGGHHIGDHALVVGLILAGEHNGVLDPGLRGEP